MRTPEATIARHRLPLLIRLHRAVFGILPWLRRNPMPAGAAAQARLDRQRLDLPGTNCGTVNPAGSGTRKTSHPALRHTAVAAGQQNGRIRRQLSHDAAVQIDWGLWYIAQRYGSPSVAWQHSEQTGWY